MRSQHRAISVDARPISAAMNPQLRSISAKKALKMRGFLTIIKLRFNLS
jgi:hypothetical protein